VIGRKSRKTSSIPVWFVLEGETINLLPVLGSETQCYRNLLKNPQIRIDARGAEGKFRAIPLTDVVFETFHEKYGAKDVKKYHSRFKAAVLLKP
jgi:hypothetical protein